MTIEEKEQLHDILHDIKQLIELEIYSLDFEFESSLLKSGAIGSNQDERLAAINEVLDNIKNSITTSENLAYLKRSKK